MTERLLAGAAVGLLDGYLFPFLLLPMLRE